MTARADLAEALWEGGRIDEAIGLYARNLSEHLRLLDPDARETRTAQLALASAYQSGGRVHEAVLWFEEAHTEALRVLGSDASGTFFIRVQLAMAYVQAGRPADAVPLLQDVLKTGSGVEGSDPESLLALGEVLADAHLAAGQTDQAIALFEDHVERATTGTPDYLNVRRKLCEAYRQAGRSSEATTLLELNLLEGMRLEGPHADGTTASRKQLAHAYAESGRAGEAVSTWMGDNEQYATPAEAAAKLAASLWTGGWHEECWTLLVDALDRAPSQLRDPSQLRSLWRNFVTVAGALDRREQAAALWSAVRPQWMGSAAASGEVASVDAALGLPPDVD